MTINTASLNKLHQARNTSSPWSARKDQLGSANRDPGVDLQSFDLVGHVFRSPVWFQIASTPTSWSYNSFKTTTSG